jgi:signal transduction histidine kinase
VAREPQLTTASSISHAQFMDSIPRLLDAYEDRIRANDGAHIIEANIEQRESASEHGLHRWQQGYDLRETMLEWAHLHRCILDELERYAEANPTLSPEILSEARKALVTLCGEGAAESATRYTLLQRAEAASRMRDLEVALEHLRALERARGYMLREAAHDIRGSVGVIAQASAVLTRSGADHSGTDFSQALERAIRSMDSMLTELIDLARLEAGEDRLEITTFDAAEVLRDMGDSMRPLAAMRSLFLNLEGPTSLPIEGDRVKLQRIAQNLVLNALKATEHGGIKVTWEPSQAGASRWTLTVQDTGPGFTPAHADPLGRALRQATTQAHDNAVRAAGAGDRSADVSSAPTLPSEDEHSHSSRRSGEGIGLAIVKRLCELLDAGLELETAAGRGTTFRLSFPMRLVHSGA